MKNNAKNRALTYIRQKNHLRHGGKLVQSVKVSNEMMEDEEFIEMQMQSMVKKTFKYKLPLEHLAQTGQDGNDFLYNLTTLRIISTKTKCHS